MPGSTPRDRGGVGAAQQGNQFCLVLLERLQHLVIQKPARRLAAQFLAVHFKHHGVATEQLQQLIGIHISISSMSLASSV